MPYFYLDDNICRVLYKIIFNWNLTDKILIIIINNKLNIVQANKLMNKLIWLLYIMHNF